MDQLACACCLLYSDGALLITEDRELLKHFLGDQLGQFFT